MPYNQYKGKGWVTLGAVMQCADAQEILDLLKSKEDCCVVFHKVSRMRLILTEAPFDG